MYFDAAVVFVIKLILILRRVVPGGAGNAWHPHILADQLLNPISTRGTDYAHLITTGIPGFSNLPTNLDRVLF